ncbi:hypothetical protein JHK87_033203 [Glycine soja]|nr:hypothetical protein JHK87_033203 [Glycine soja]
MMINKLDSLAEAQRKAQEDCDHSFQGHDTPKLIDTNDQADNQHIGCDNQIGRNGSLIYSSLEPSHCTYKDKEGGEDPYHPT